MTWFKVDDRLPMNGKAIQAGAALALWTMAGAYAASQENDGFVPDYMATRLFPMEGQEWAQRLVDVGLWEEGTRRHETGWWFHDWADYQPTSAHLRAERERRARNQAAYRDRRRGDRSLTDHVTGDSPARVTDHSSVSDPVSDHGPARPGPTRPVGTPPGSQGGAGGTDADEAPAADESAGSASRKRSAARKGHRLPDEWWPSESELEWFRRECPTLAGQSGAGSRATESFRDYWHGESGQRASKRDWTAAWRNWMRREESQAGRQPRPSSSGPRPTSDDRIAAFLGGGSSSAEPQPYDVALPYDDQPAQLPAGGDHA